MNADGNTKKVPEKVQEWEKETLEKNKMKLKAYQESKDLFEKLMWNLIIFITYIT